MKALTNILDNIAAFKYGKKNLKLNTAKKLGFNLTISKFSNCYTILADDYSVKFYVFYDDRVREYNKRQQDIIDTIIFPYI